MALQHGSPWNLTVDISVWAGLGRLVGSFGKHNGLLLVPYLYPSQTSSPECAYVTRVDQSSIWSLCSYTVDLSMSSQQYPGILGYVTRCKCGSHFSDWYECYRKHVPPTSELESFNSISYLSLVADSNIYSLELPFTPTLGHLALLS